MPGAFVSGHAQSVDPLKRPTRIDVGGFLYSFSEGSGEYGPWWGTRLKATNSPPAGMLGATGIFELVTESHRDTGNESSGVYGAGTAYYDWNQRVFTLSSIGLGSGDPLLKFNLYNEVDLKLFRGRHVVGLGAGYLDYHDVNSASYLSFAASYFWTDTFGSPLRVVLQYNYRRYFAEPIHEQTGAHILVAGFGAEGRWTRVQYIHGRDLFRAGGDGAPVFDADFDGNVLALQHEESLTQSYGFTIGLDFVNKSRNGDGRTLFSGPGAEVGFFWNL